MCMVVGVVSNLDDNEFFWFYNRVHAHDAVIRKTDHIIVAKC